MPVASAVAGIGSSIVGGILGANAASNAASAETTQDNAAIAQNNVARNNALGLQQQMYQTDEQNYAPYQTAGVGALNQLAGATLSGQPNAQTVLAQDPGYQFRLDQQNQAVQRMEAASGGVGSGGALKAAAEFSGNLASNEYENSFNRLMTANQQRFGQLYGIAGIGQNANAALTQAGENYANQGGAYDMNTAAMNSGLLQSIGSAQAAGILGQANSINGAISGGLNAATGFLPPQSTQPVNSSGYTMPATPYTGNVPYSQLATLGGANDVGQYGPLPQAPPPTYQQASQAPPIL